MATRVPPLPFALDALEPHVGAETVEVHYEKHHKGYAKKLDELLEEAPEKDASLEHLIQTAEGELFNNAAQVWNHTFYWQSLRKSGGGRPVGELLAHLERSFGSFADFQRSLAEVAEGQFGSGWAWLASDGHGRLRVLATSNAHNPLHEGMTPLLTIDVWEHAYYLDYRNERDRYVRGVIEHLLDWEFAAENLRRAARAEAPRPRTARR